MKNGIFLLGWVSVCCLSFVLLGAVPVNAQVPILFQQGVNGYEGTHDTFYQTGAPDSVHGADDWWEWDNSDAGGENFGVIRFDDIVGTNPGQVPPNTAIISAVLYLYVDDDGGSADIFELLAPFDDTLDFYSFGDGSGEIPLEGVDYFDLPAGSAENIASGTLHEIDLTESVQKIVNGGDNWTKRLRRRKGEAELIGKRRSLALSRGLLCILSKTDLTN